MLMIVILIFIILLKNGYFMCVFCLFLSEFVFKIYLEYKLFDIIEFNFFENNFIVY